MNLEYNQIAEVINDFIPVTLQNEIEEVVFNMPWFFRPTIAQFPGELYKDSDSPFEDPRVSDAFAFAHTCFSDGNVQTEYFHFFKTVLRFLEFKKDIRIKDILRIRLRLTPQFPGHTEDMFNPPHIDIMSTEQFYTFVYYVFDSDGDTVIFNRKYDNLNLPTVLTKNEPDLQPIFTNTPKKGEGVLFDGLYYHSGNSPVKHKGRCVINFDFTVHE
jgi:hypothetical protein